jgi:hypothetical protein
MKRRPTTGLIPAAARPDPQAMILTEAEADLSADAIATFETALGGRDALIDALCVADGTPEVDKVTALLLDMRYDGWSLRRICALANLTVADFFTAYRKAALVRAHLQLIPVITAKLVGVVDDLLTRAQPHYVRCDACNGTTTFVPEPTKDLPNPSPQPCKACKGTGQHLLLPDLDRQKLALEVAEVIKPKSGFTFNQANVLAADRVGSNPTAPGALEQMQQAVNAILFKGPAPSTRAPIEAEVVPEVPAP